MNFCIRGTTQIAAGLYRRATSRNPTIPMRLRSSHGKRLLRARRRRASGSEVMGRLNNQQPPVFTCHRLSVCWIFRPSSSQPLLLLLYIIAPSGVIVKGFFQVFSRKSARTSPEFIRPVNAAPRSNVENYVENVEITRGKPAKTGSERGGECGKPNPLFV